MTTSPSAISPPREQVGQPVGVDPALQGGAIRPKRLARAEQGKHGAVQPRAGGSSWWAGEPTLRRQPWRWLVWLLDEALDRLPAREDGRWYRHGGWGCRFGLHRWWVTE